MKKRRNPLAQFMIGMVMLAAGLYWFLSNVTTHFGLQIWNVRLGAGLIVVPFIAGIIWLFINVDSFGAKLLTVLGIVVILASIIANIQFIFRATSLYVYLIMLVLIFGGAALVGQVLFRWPKDEDKKKSGEKRDL